MESANLKSTSYPQWTEQIYQENVGEDFLGLRSVSTNITTYLLPGIITITPRARYYSFYCWLLHEYEQQHPKGYSLQKFIKKREQIFGLANLAFDKAHSYGKSIAGMIGTIKLGNHLNNFENSTIIPLTVDDYIQASFGGYSQYNGVMRNLNLTRESDDPHDQILMPSSKLLAESFENAIVGTEYFKNRHLLDTTDSISLNCLIEYGRHCYLSGLAESDDAEPILEALFAFSAEVILPNPDTNLETRGNMCGSLGLILDMLNQSQKSLSDNDFRNFAMYGCCKNFSMFSPSPQLMGFLAHWQIFQIRELYVYSLYELWIYFLHFLREHGPFSYDYFINNLGKISFNEPIQKFLSLSFRGDPLSEISTFSAFDFILSESGISRGNFLDQCKEYSSNFDDVLNESLVYDLLNKPPNDFSREDRLILSTLMLLEIYLRLKGIQQTDTYNAWRWAQEGGVRRRSLEIFVWQMDEQVKNEKSLFETLDWLFRDYIIAQHTITALEKWHQRGANTFHFNFENGIFEWIDMDSNGLSASRFSNAYNMIHDIGLADFQESEKLLLTERGKKTLSRVLKKLEKYNE